MEDTCSYSEKTIPRMLSAPKLDQKFTYVLYIFRNEGKSGEVVRSVSTFKKRKKSAHT